MLFAGGGAEPEQGKQWRLPRTQAQAGGDGACTVCATLFADAVLHRQIALQPKLLDRMLGAGCDAWQKLVAEERRAALGIPASRHLTVHDVVSGLVDVATGRPRWRIVRELYGMHVSGQVPRAILDELQRSRVTDNSDNAVPMEYCDDLRAALRRFDSALDDDNGESNTQVAAVLTWNSGAHSVCIGARAYGDNGEYYVIDSLNGTYAEFVAPKYFVEHVAWRVCPAHIWAAGDGAGASLPGQFFISMLTLA